MSIENKQNNAKLFLKVSAAVKGTTVLQGTQVNLSIDNKGWCPHKNLIKKQTKMRCLGVYLTEIRVENKMINGL